MIKKVLFVFFSVLFFAANLVLFAVSVIATVEWWRGFYEALIVNREGFAVLHLHVWLLADSTGFRIASLIFGITAYRTIPLERTREENRWWWNTLSTVFYLNTGCLVILTLIAFAQSGHIYINIDTLSHLQWGEYNTDLLIDELLLDAMVYFFAAGISLMFGYICKKNIRTTPWYLP